MSIMKFGPHDKTLSKSVSFGQNETLRFQITILKQCLEEGFPGRFLTSKCLQIFLWYLYQIEIEQPDNEGQRRSQLDLLRRLTLT